VIKDVFGGIILFGVLLIPVFIFISRLFRGYELTNKYANAMLIFVMIFGSPIAILGSYAVITFAELPFEPSLRFKLVALICVSIAFAVLRYGAWIWLFGKTINSETFLVFSKRYIFQVPYLLIGYFIIFNTIKTVEDEIFLYLTIAMLASSIFIIFIYLIVKEIILEGAFK
jgi:hypothetical protein